MRGTAVLGSDAGAIPDVVVHGQTGFLAPPGDVAAWTDHLVRMLGDRSLCVDFGAAGRRRALDAFGRDRHTDRIMELYEMAQLRLKARKAGAADRRKHKEPAR